MKKTRQILSSQELIVTAKTRQADLESYVICFVDRLAEYLPCTLVVVDIETAKTFTLGEKYTVQVLGPEQEPEQEPALFAAAIESDGVPYIKVSDFHAFPAGRYRKHGPASAEAFRDEVLVPALGVSPTIGVNLDTVGLSASWLEEVFGGLVRLGLDVMSRVTLYGPLGVRDQIAEYVRDAAIGAQQPEEVA